MGGVIPPEKLFQRSSLPVEDEGDDALGSAISPEKLFGSPVIPPVQKTAREVIQKIQGPGETTSLPDERLPEFQVWLKRNGITDLDHPDSHYDYRGAFLAGVNRSPNGHLPDAFKQHGHPTFSDESQYARGDGGHWIGDTFLPQIAPPEPFARDVTGAARSVGVGGDPGRRARLERERAEYLASPQKIVDDLKASEQSIGPDVTGFDKFRQKLASTRLFTDKSLIEFDVGNSTGFHIGTPLNHPVETAANLVMGLPMFFVNLVKQPAELMLNEMVRGTPSEILLPEERSQYFKEVIANYAGLVVGGATGALSRNMRVGREMLRYGTQVREAAGIAASTEELVALRATLPRALSVENDALQKMITGAHEGAAGGFVSGAILEKDARDEGRLNETMAYVISALPIGIAFEGAKSLKRTILKQGDELGPLATAANDASELFIIRQMQASEGRTMQQNVETFYHMATSDELAQATIRAHRALDGSTVIPAVKNPKLIDFEDADVMMHQRPDGLYDLAIGIPDGLVERRKGIGEGPVGEIAPKVPFSDRVANGEGQPAVMDDAGKIWTRKTPAEHGDLRPWAEDEGASFTKGPEQSGWILDKKFVSVLDLENERKAILTTPEPKPTILDDVHPVSVNEARAMFEVGGHFPNQHVSFLGRDYTYVRPVLNKKGVLESHIIKYADGSDFEVPWDQLRRGPDLMINNYEASPFKTRKAIFKDFERVVKDNDIAADFPDVPFKDMITKYVGARNLPQQEIGPLTAFLGEQMADQLRLNHLPMEELAAYNRMVHESRRYPAELSSSLADVASSNGMHVERATGGLLVVDSQTNEVLGHFKSPEAAKRFINTSGQGSGPDLTPSGPVPPDAINRGLMAVPPPPNGPHTAAFTPAADGSLARLNHWFNTTWIGTHITGMQQIMKSMDSQSLLTDPKARTEFYAKVADPLQRAFKLKFAAMTGDSRRLAATSRMARGLTPDQLDQVTTAIETMDPVDMVKPGGLFPRGFTEREIAAADWFVKNEIDIAKAFAYRRGLKRLEEKYATRNPDEINEAVKRLQISTNVDEAHIEAARIIGTVLRINKPGELSIYGITRLADGIMKKHTNPDVYMKESGFTPQMYALRSEVKSHFKDLTKVSEIPDEQQLGGYFAHFKMYKDDQIFTQPDGTPVFTSELLRTGEMSEFDRDPINVLNRYMNMAYNNKYVKSELDVAYKYVNETTAKMPVGGEFFKKLLTDHYINQLRGVPLESSKLAQKLFEEIFPRMGMKIGVDVRKDLVNTFVSLQSSAMIGFRPMQGVRDLENLSAIYFTRFGAERTASMFTMMHRVKPEELVAAGFLKEAKPEEGIGAAFEREGLTSRYGPISVLSPQERLANTISAKSQPFREAVQKLGEMGVDWSLQHNVYQWAHAATMLESTTKTLKELNKLNEGAYGAGETAKAKAYDNLFINSYDLPVVREFDRLVSAGQIREAADFLGRATAFETVGTFGLANHPAGWGTSTGKLFGQFGNWSVWARSMLARQATRGTTAERTRVAARFGLTQGSLALASAALGLNLNSWYLPTGLPIVSALGHLGAATEEFDEERTAELQKAAAVVALGVPGSLLFRGGPALGLATAAMAGGTGTEQGESEAVRAGGGLAKRLVPGSYLLQDILLGVAMAQNGDNPVSAWLQALGIRSTENPSVLNPEGAFKPAVSDIEF